MKMTNSSSYLRDMNTVKIADFYTDHDEAVKAVLEAQKDPEKMNKLVHSYFPMIYSVIARFMFGNCPTDIGSLFSIGAEATLRALREYKGIRKNGKVGYSHVVAFVKRGIITAIRNEIRTIRVSGTASKMYTGQMIPYSQMFVEPHNDSHVSELDIQLSLEQLLETLPELERSLVIDNWGVFGHDRLTIAEMEKKYSISKYLINLILSRAYKKLANITKTDFNGSKRYGLPPCIYYKPKGYFWVAYRKKVNGKRQQIYVGNFKKLADAKRALNEALEKDNGAK